MKKCYGCLSIKHNLFPFTTNVQDENYEDIKGNFIDQEGCGVEPTCSSIYLCWRW